MSFHMPVPTGATTVAGGIIRRVQQERRPDKRAVVGRESELLEGGVLVRPSDQPSAVNRFAKAHPESVVAFCKASRLVGGSKAKQEMLNHTDAMSTIIKRGGKPSEWVEDILDRC